MRCAMPCDVEFSAESAAGQIISSIMVGAAQTRKLGARGTASPGALQDRELF
ncbi:hypothetical protein MCEMSEM18_01139 [Comamonadaceae bacterium]